MLNAATRLEALLMALPFYQGAPCKRGHAGTRYTSTKACCDCAAEQGQGRRRSGKRTAEQRRNWTAANIDKVKALRRARAALAKVARAPIIAAHKAEQQVKREAATLAREAAKQHNKEAREAKRAAMVTDKKARRRQRERDAAGSHSKAAASILLAMQRGCCAYCGDPATQRDHKIALAQGGTNDLQNIQWLCKPCNTAKWAHDDATERARRGIAERTQWDANPLQAEMLLVALLI